MTVCMFSFNLECLNDFRKTLSMKIKGVLKNKGATVPFQSKLITLIPTCCTGASPCHCVYVCGWVLTLIHEGFTGLGLKGTKVKKPQGNSCPFQPVLIGQQCAVDTECIVQPSRPWVKNNFSFYNFSSICLMGFYQNHFVQRRILVTFVLMMKNWKQNHLLHSG